MTKGLIVLSRNTLNYAIIVLLFIHISCKKEVVEEKEPSCVQMSNPVEGLNYLAADDISNEFRTGEVDPAVLSVPSEIESEIKIDPEKYSSQLVQYFVSNSVSDFQTVKRMHDWITLHIAYDNDYFYGIGDGHSDPVNVIKDGKTTCGGFAALLAYFCEFANIETVVINGISRTSFNSSTNEMSNHVWLAVGINCTWYIVDATHNSRFSYNNGVFGVMGDYKDTYLFVSPKAKIIMNYPNEEQYQFLHTTVSKEDFLAFPLVNMNYVKYGLDIEPDIISLIKKEKKEDKADYLFTITDIIEVNSLVSFEIHVPENVSLNALMLNSDGSYNHNYAFQYIEENKVICQFAAPPAGEYQAYLSANFLDPYEIYSQRVYEFTIRSNGNGATTIPIPGNFYVLPNNFLYQAEIVESNLTAAPYSLTVRHSKDYELFSGIYISSDNNVQEKAIVTEINSDASTKTIRYDYPLYSLDDYLIKVKAKNAGDSYFTDVVIMARIKK